MKTEENNVYDIKEKLNSIASSTNPENEEIFFFEEHVKEFGNLVNDLLFKACEANNEKIAKILIGKVANKDAENEFGETPLHIACANGHTDIAKMLLEAGANKDAENKHRETPLHLACMNGHIDIAKMLLEAGANFNAQGTYLETPLYLACEKGHTDIAKMLLEAGASRDAKDGWNNTPLHIACANGHTDIAKMLLEAGASIDAKNVHRETPLHLAREGGHKETAEMLVEKGANINIECKDSKRPLESSHSNNKASRNKLIEIIHNLYTKTDEKLDLKTKSTFQTTTLPHKNIFEKIGLWISNICNKLINYFEFVKGKFSNSPKNTNELADNNNINSQVSPRTPEHKTTNSSLV